MIAAFSMWTDSEGNAYMARGPVVARQASPGPFFIGAGGLAIGPEESGEYAAAGAGGASFEGGNGTNLTAGSSPLGTLVPYGKFKVTGPDSWGTTNAGNLSVTFAAGDGHSEIHDGTDVVATTPAGGTIAPYGTFASTPYGEAAYGGGSPWTVDLDYEGAAGPFPQRPTLVVIDAAGAQSGSYTRTDWQAWESADDPSWTVTIDSLGAGELEDGTDVVATRAADAAKLCDPTGGDWVATPYGKATYGAATTVTTGTRSAGTFPEQDWELAATVGSIEYWAGRTVATHFVELDTSTGDALLKDGTDVVGERLGGSTTSPDGTYDATVYGGDAYGSGGGWTYDLATTAAGEDFTVRMSLGRGTTTDGVWYVTLFLDAVTDELLGTSPGPSFAGVLPTSTATEFYWPVAEVSGGRMTQIQYGPIQWAPRV